MENAGKRNLLVRVLLGIALVPLFRMALRGLRSRTAKLAAERAHPDHPGFAWPVRAWLHRGWIPRVGRNPYRREFLERYAWFDRVAQGQKVLDVPSGVGWGTSLVRSASLRCGLELDAGAVFEAQQRYGEAASFLVGSMEALPYASGRFGVVACLEGIEHVPDAVAESFLSEAARVLRPGGRLLLSSPYRKDGQHSGNPHHLHEYQPEEIRALLGSRFEIESSFERNQGALTTLYLEARSRS